MRRSLAVSSLVLVMSVIASASERDATWVRYPAVSPNGRTVAFAYRGDIWTVSSQGGGARRITTHEAIETRPVWSPDGSRIAFASDRHGNFDVFVMDAAGGAATRLTFHSAADFPCGFEPDGSRVLFTSARQDAPASILPSSRIAELWSIPAAGGRPQMELTTPAEWARVSPDGAQVAYEDRKGYEDTFRKHHTSPVTRDVWVWNRADGSHTKLTSFGGEDRNPVWSADGATLYYLSEQGGASNVYRLAADGSEGPEPVSVHATHPVRFLSIAKDGLLCYGWNGGVYTLREGEAPTRVTIRVAADERRNAVRREVERKGADDVAVSPDGEEIAFVVRGEVFVASVEHGTTKRITTTPGQERSVTWAPDGKALYYAAERSVDDIGHGTWDIFRATMTHPDEDERFHRATAVTETRAVGGEAAEEFQPVVSPDGKHVAFVRDRDEICVQDLASGSIRTMVPAERNYSYSDGDLGFSWSPDSRWLAVTYLANRSWIEQIGIVDVAAGTIRDVTMSGYYESNPKWSPDGRALFFVSDRRGSRSHGSWGSEKDVYALYLTQAAYDRAMLPEEEFARLVEKEDKAKGGKRGKRGGDGAEREDDADESKKDEPPPVVEIEFADIERRLRRITRHSAQMSDFVVSNDGEACLYFAEMDGTWDVWLVKPRQGETKRLISIGEKRGGGLTLTRDGKTLFVRTGDGRVMKAGVGGALESSGGGRGGRGGRGGGNPGGGGGGGGGVSTENVGFAAELHIDEAAEREYLFEHMWRQAGAKFYREDLHGVDWPAMRANYAQFLPEIENGFEFAELASELLGELNASHTGCRWRPEREGGDDTAALGLLFDTTWAADGLRIAEVLPGGPCAMAETKIREGCVLTAIDGAPLGPDQNPWALLDHKAGERVRLRFRDPTSGVQEQVVRPIAGGAEGGLLYRRLLERRRALVAKASGGRVGYVHVAGMNDGSFRHLYQEALGRNADKEALIVDTRFNGGGWLHDDLVVFLSGKRYMDFVPRGKVRGSMGGEPIQRWDKPSCMVMSEGNYSDAHLSPLAYRMMGVGKLVGAPVAGTGTAVWWERLMTGDLVFGIPQVGMVDPDGNYAENQTLEPDVLVLTDPVKIAEGVDEQLEAAVKLLLEELR